MNARYLLLLADYLEKSVSATLLNMKEWRDFQELGCGCAAFHAGKIPALVAAGYSCRRFPQFRHAGGYTALRDFFEIDSEQTEFLFSSTAYDRNPTPEQVAARIRNFVKSKGAFKWQKHT
jgi:hypothetical protein